MLPIGALLSQALRQQIVPWHGIRRTQSLRVFSYNPLRYLDTKTLKGMWRQHGRPDYLVEKATGRPAQRRLRQMRARA